MKQNKLIYNLPNAWQGHVTKFNGHQFLSAIRYAGINVMFCVFTTQSSLQGICRMLLLFKFLQIWAQQGISAFVKHRYFSDIKDVTLWEGGLITSSLSCFFFCQKYFGVASLYVYELSMVFCYKFHTALFFVHCSCVLHLSRSHRLSG